MPIAGTIPPPPPPPPVELFNSNFSPILPYMLDRYYECAGVTTTNTTAAVMTPVTAVAPLSAISPSRTPNSHSDSSSNHSESAVDEIRSAFVPLRLHNLPPSTVPSSASSPPEKRKPTEGVRNELKAPTALICNRQSPTAKRSPTPTKIPSTQTTKPVWRPY